MQFIRMMVAAWATATAMLATGCTSLSSYGDHVSAVDGDPMQHWIGQDDPRWCWAACLQMHASISGHTMPEQDVLVDRFKLGASDYIPGANSIEVIRLALDEAQGHFEREIIDLDDAAASWEIQEALAPGHRQFMRDRGCVVIDIEDAIGPKLSQRQLLDSLLAKDPIIVTLTENNEWSRHAYLLVSASLKNGKVIKYGLLDPLDGRQLYELDASEYNRRVRAEVTRAQAAEHLAAERLWVETQGLSNGVYVRNPIESKSGRYGRALIEVVRPSQLRPVYSLEVDPLELSL